MRPKRSLGQNFLVDPNIQLKIVAAVRAGAADEVLEIGPGPGALTRHLAGKVRRLVAIEKDDQLARALRAELGSVPGVSIVHADILDVRLADLVEDVPLLEVVGNIPYNITTPVLFHLLEPRPRPRAIVLMVQREVADRILASPGEKPYGALSIGVRAAAEVERLFHVSRGAFWPVPDVDSTVLRIVPHRPPRLAEAEEQDMRTLTRAAFAWRRKQLQKTLRVAPEYGLSPAELARVAAESGLALEARPETLSPEQFVALTGALRAGGYPRRKTPPSAELRP